MLKDFYSVLIRSVRAVFKLLKKTDPKQKLDPGPLKGNLHGSLNIYCLFKARYTVKG